MAALVAQDTPPAQAQSTLPRLGFLGGHTQVVTEVEDIGVTGDERFDLRGVVATYSVGIESALTGDTEVKLVIADRETPATQGEDYRIRGTSPGDSPNTKLLKIPRGQTSASFEVFIRADQKTDPDESISIDLQAIEHAPYRVADGGGYSRNLEIVILDDSTDIPSNADSQRGMELNPARQTVAASGTFTYTVSLASQPSANVTITPLVFNRDHSNVNISVSPASGTIAATAWTTALTFTVTAPAQAGRYIIFHYPTSTDLDYAYNGHFFGPGVHGWYLPVTVSSGMSGAPPETNWCPDVTFDPQTGEPIIPDCLDPQAQLDQDQPTTKYADLIANMRDWRDDPLRSSHQPHVDRWDRALLAFGETVADSSLSPMTAAEAQTYVDRGWTRWVAVVQALKEIEAAAQQSTNNAPTVSSAIADATIVNASGTKRISLSGVFTDADNDGLTISAGTSNSAVAAVSVSADYSTLTVRARSRGTATITVTASDGNGGTVADTFTVTVKAAPTVASAIGDISGMELFGTSEISLSGVFTDADGDSLTITAESSDDFVASAVVGQDNELTIFALQAGSVTVTVTAEDADGNTVSDVFSVSVGAPQPQPVNNAPTVSSAIADATIVNESGTKRISLSGVFTDADNDSLTISAGTSNSAVATVSVAADYSALTVSAQGRGTATITVTASDGNGGTVSDSFSLRVKSAPVVASDIADVSGLTAGTSRDVWLSSVFRDADGDSLTISAASSNSGVASVNVAGGGSRLRLTGAALGAATITVTARDADGNAVSDSFAVTVTAPPAAEPDTTTDSPLAGVAARYDANGDGVIDEDEYLKAVDDYDDGKLTILEILQVRRARQAAPR